MQGILNKIKNYYFIVTTLGIILSILWVIFVKTKPMSDFNYYNQLAIDIANSGFWGDTRQAIGYPIILGFIYWIFGAGIIKAKIFNLFLTFSNFILFYCILRKIEIKQSLKKLMFIIFVFFPNNIFYNSILAKEIVMTTFLLLVTYIYLSKIKYKYIYMGILTGIITIIHASFIVYILGIFLVNVICKRKFKKMIISSLVMFVCTLITIAPLVIRNSKLMHQFTYVSTNSGVVLYINNNSQNKTGTWMSADDVENSVVNTEAFKNGNRAERCKIFKAAASKWIKAHPKRFIQLGMKRLNNTYFAGEDIFWTYRGVNFSYVQKQKMQLITKSIRKIVFIPAIIFILFLSIMKIADLIKNTVKKDNINYKFEVYLLMLFYMFSSTQFITEGQSRYFFPLIFIMVFFFAKLLFIILQNLILKYKY